MECFDFFFSGLRKVNIEFLSATNRLNKVIHTKMRRSFKLQSALQCSKRVNRPQLRWFDLYSANLLTLFVLEGDGQNTTHSHFFAFSRQKMMKVEILVLPLLNILANRFEFVFGPLLIWLVRRGQRLSNMPWLNLFLEAQNCSKYPSRRGNQDLNNQIMSAQCVQGLPSNPSDKVKRYLMDSVFLEYSQ